MSLQIEGQISATNLPRVNDRDEWTVYGADYCPYTQKTLKYLKDNNMTYTYHQVEGSDREVLTKRTNGHKTIPAVYHYDKFIGGSDSFLALMKK